MNSKRPRRAGSSWLALCLAALGVACGGSATRDADSPASTPEPRRAVEPVPLAPTKIVFAMGGIENDFRKCFFRNPSDRGTLRVRWDADTSGVVTDAQVVSSTLTTPAIETCLVERVSELRFGRLEEPSRGEWVFVFRLVSPQESKPTTTKTGRGKAARANQRKAKSVADDEDGDSIALASDSVGFLDPGRIANVVEAGLPLFARCYRAGLSRHEALSGNVRFRFVIGESGRVESIADRGSDLPDPFAVDCVAEGFYALEFPRPEGGPVSVDYRIRLN